MKIARDKAFQRLQKLEKGKHTHRLGEINRRHKASLQMTSEIQEYHQSDSNMGWQVHSQQQQGILYTIRKLTDQCDCKMRCSSCGICIHMYSCTCMDATIHTTICKHIHYIHMSITITMPSHTMDAGSTSTCDDNAVNAEYFSRILSSGSSTHQTKLQLHSGIYRLQELTHQCTNNSILKAALGHVKAAISVMTAMDKHPQHILPLKRTYGPNKNSEKQHRFLSTKKKRTATPTLSTPSLDTLLKCKETLQQIVPRRCGVCLHEEDNSSGNIIDWMK